MSNLSNKVAVVTGGNSGIGYATAKELIGLGAKVIITGRNRTAVEKAAGAARGDGACRRSGQAGGYQPACGRSQGRGGQDRYSFSECGRGKF
ncbi:SDR family NAD(P)-dependent oxidoreductase [Puia sp. P3]|uniref:SDR family NAD(P)-dependent oxidoreductase n=1 Tax=Puia sp. P3 TaxID=3423952 RepID=UPI003D676808